MNPLLCLVAAYCIGVVQPGVVAFLGGTRIGPSTWSLFSQSLELAGVAVVLLLTIEMIERRAARRRRRPGGDRP